MWAVRVVVGHQWLWDKASPDLVSSSKAVWGDTWPCRSGPHPALARKYIWMLFLQRE